MGNDDTGAGTSSSESVNDAYAAELENQHDKTTNPTAKEILQDGKITDAEAQTVLESFRVCLDSVGIHLDSYDSDGVVMTGDPQKIAIDQINAKAQTCSVETGESTVLSLYHLMKKDPEKRFTPQSVVDCYVRAGLVPETFSVEEYTSNGLERLYPGQQLHSPSGAEALEKIDTCDRNPIDSYAE